MSRLSTIRALLTQYDSAADADEQDGIANALVLHVRVLCDIAEAAGRVTEADNPNVVTDPAAHRALIDALDELKEKVAALSRLGSPEGDGPDA